MRQKTIVLHAIMAVHSVIVIVCLLSGPILIRQAMHEQLAPPIIWFCLGFAPFICLLRILNGRECILQTWAKRLRGTGKDWARDIYLLPRRWALRIVLLGAVSYATGAAAMLAANYFGSPA